MESRGLPHSLGPGESLQLERDLFAWASRGKIQAQWEQGHQRLTDWTAGAEGAERMKWFSARCR